MTAGTDTYFGLAAPLYGEFEVKATAGDEAIDIVTITSSTGTLTGDYFVARTGALSEVAYLNAGGNWVVSVGSTLAVGGVVVNITSTGALAAGAENVNGVVVVASTKSVLNDVFSYHGSATGTAQSLLGVTSTHAPTYFLRVAASGGAGDYGVGAALANGFFTPPNFFYVSAPTTSIPMGAIKILAGSKAYYIPIIPDTGMASS